MKTLPVKLISGLAIVLLAAAAIAANAGWESHKLVIQVSTDDPQVQQMALNNAINVQKELGMDNVIIEVVAYGPGLSMLTANNPASQRVPNLAMQSILFTACGNTMDTIERNTGEKVVLVDGVSIVKAGVVRIMELQEQGYAYVRP